jgi:hypothetical protein
MSTETEFKFDVKALFLKSKKDLKRNILNSGFSFSLKDYLTHSLFLLRLVLYFTCYRMRVNKSQVKSKY